MRQFLSQNIKNCSKGFNSYKRLYGKGFKTSVHPIQICHSNLVFRDIVALCFLSRNFEVRTFLSFKGSFSKITRYMRWGGKSGPIQSIVNRVHPLIKSLCQISWKYLKSYELDRKLDIREGRQTTGRLWVQWRTELS